MRNCLDEADEKLPVLTEQLGKTFKTKLNSNQQCEEMAQPVNAEGVATC